MPVNEQVVDAVTIENVKIGAGAPAHYSASAMNSHAGLQAAVNSNFAVLLQIQTTALQQANILSQQALQNGIAISQAATASAVRSLTELDAVEAMSNAVVGQQGAKVAQSTPPETAKPS